MKHHRYMQGWRDINNMRTGALLKEILSVAVVYGVVIGLVVIAVQHCTR